jgi:hypothetical protein
MMSADAADSTSKNVIQGRRCGGRDKKALFFFSVINCRSSTCLLLASVPNHMECNKLTKSLNRRLLLRWRRLRWRLLLLAWQWKRLGWQGVRRGTRRLCLRLLLLRPLGCIPLLSRRELLLRPFEVLSLDRGRGAPERGSTRQVGGQQRRHKLARACGQLYC